MIRHRSKVKECRCLGRDLGKRRRYLETTFEEDVSDIYNAETLLLRSLSLLYRLGFHNLDFILTAVVSNGTNTTNKSSIIQLHYTEGVHGAEYQGTQKQLPRRMFQRYTTLRH